MVWYHLELQVEQQRLQLGESKQQRIGAGALVQIASIASGGSRVERLAWQDGHLELQIAQQGLQLDEGRQQVGQLPLQLPILAVQHGPLQDELQILLMCPCMPSTESSGSACHPEFL